MNIYTSGLLELLNWVGGGKQWILCASGYAPDFDADTTVSDLTNEYAGGAYSRQAFAGGTVTVVAGAQQLDCSAPTFNTSNDSVHLTNLILAEDTNNDATDLLLAQWIIDVTTDGSSITPDIPAAGPVAITASPNCSVLVP